MTVEAGVKDGKLAPGGLGIRHLQCLMYFLGISIAYTNRTCVSIAIVAIQEEQKNSDLNSDHVGYILSSFLWGYAVMQVPWGHLARVWSTKWVVGIGILINGFAGLLCPIVYDEGGWIYLCACRVLMGLFQACLLPSIHTLLAEWVPPAERGKLCTPVYAGTYFGTVVSYPVSGILIDLFGWRSVFYFFAALAIIWSILFLIFFSDSPAHSAERTFFRISEEERKYIESSLGVEEKAHANEKKDAKVPWASIFTSLPFWALLMAHTGHSWGFWMLLTETPIYMRGILNFDIKKNGLISALPYIAAVLLTIPASGISDWCERRGFARGLLRKVCNSIGHWGPALTLIGMAFVPTDSETLPVILLVLASGLNVVAVCGFQINHMDLSPSYAGILMSFTNCAASISGLLAPLITGKIVTDSENVEQWKIVFLLSAGIYFLGNLMFVLFGSATIQEWDGKREKDEFAAPRPRPRTSSIVPCDAVIE